MKKSVTCSKKGSNQPARWLAPVSSEGSGFYPSVCTRLLWVRSSCLTGQKHGHRRVASCPGHHAGTGPKPWCEDDEERQPDDLASSDAVPSLDLHPCLLGAAAVLLIYSSRTVSVLADRPIRPHVLPLKRKPRPSLRVSESSSGFQQTAVDFKKINKYDHANEINPQSQRNGRASPAGASEVLEGDLESADSAENTNKTRVFAAPLQASC